METIKRVIELNDNNREQIKSFLLMVFPILEIKEETLERFIHILNNDLNDREEAAIIYRYGLDGNEKHTLKETGEIFGVVCERIRQMISKAIKKLRHPVRSRYIMGIEASLPKARKEIVLTGDTEIDNTNLSIRTKTCLIRAGITTIEQLFNMTDEDFIHVKNLGKKCTKEIYAFKDNYLDKVK